MGSFTHQDSARRICSKLSIGSMFSPTLMTPAAPLIHWCKNWGKCLLSMLWPMVRVRRMQALRSSKRSELSRKSWKRFCLKRWRVQGVQLRAEMLQFQTGLRNAGLIPCTNLWGRSWEESTWPGRRSGHRARSVTECSKPSARERLSTRF